MLIDLAVMRMNRVLPWSSVVSLCLDDVSNQATFEGTFIVSIVSPSSISLYVVCSARKSISPLIVTGVMDTYTKSFPKSSPA